MKKKRLLDYLKSGFMFAISLPFMIIASPFRFVSWLLNRNKKPEVLAEAAFIRDETKTLKQQTLALIKQQFKLAFKDDMTLSKREQREQENFINFESHIMSSNESKPDAILSVINRYRIELSFESSQKFLDRLDAFVQSELVKSVDTAAVKEKTVNNGLTELSRTAGQASEADVHRDTIDKPAEKTRRDATPSQGAVEEKTNDVKPELGESTKNTP